MPKAMVTGASGFIGAHLVNELLANNWEVGVVTRNRDVAHNSRLIQFWDNLFIVEADVRHRQALKKIMGWRPDVVFHLAAFNHVGNSYEQAEEVYQVNALGSANVLDVCAFESAVVYVSSSEVYGFQETVPWHESMEPRPQSPYAISKYAGELHARMHRRFGNRVGVVRPFNTFGPGQSEKAIIPELIIKALNDATMRVTEGKQTREFNFVSDTVRGIRLAGEQLLAEDGIQAEAINLGSGAEVKISHLVERIHELCDSTSKIERSVPYRRNEIWRMFSNSNLALEELGWQSEVSFDEGLARTVDAFKGATQ